MATPIVLARFRLQEQSKRDRSVWYVAQVKGDGGKDWGWTTDRSQAINVGYGWARRFMADRRHCGSTHAEAIEVTACTR